jgi:hypothetical protein
MQKLAQLSQVERVFINEVQFSVILQQSGRRFDIRRGESRNSIVPEFKEMI